jgi:twitching motility protein PilT
VPDQPHDLEDLDRLVSELHQTSSAAPSPAARSASPLQEWLQRVRELDGSDLLLVAGMPPVARVRGQVSRLPGDALSGDRIESLVHSVVPSRLRDAYREGAAVDLAFTLRGLGRFRMNLHRERGRAAAAIRALPMRIPRIPDLHFTHDVALLAELPRGLVLVCGPTGSGKTTTLAALVAEINARHPRHIVTVEDPIEYEHPHGRSIVEQVEIGIDTPDFPTALRAAMRQAPDVIVVGELRDPDTMRIALSAAETGHLVLATIHATDAAAAVSRITDGFPAERQNAVRQELAMALAAVLTQSLVLTRARILVPVAELLVVSYGARQHIRKNALQHLNQEITITRRAGSFSLEESLAKLVAGGMLERADAMLKAAHPDELESILRSAPL